MKAAAAAYCPLHSILSTDDAAAMHDNFAWAQVRKAFDMDHETITQLAEQEEAGSSGANFLPFLTGERTPNWPHSYGVITGIRQGGMRPGLLYRAALEGATFSLVNGEDGLLPSQRRRYAMAAWLILASSQLLSTSGWLRVHCALPPFLDAEVQRTGPHAYVVCCAMRHPPVQVCGCWTSIEIIVNELHMVGGATKDDSQLPLSFFPMLPHPAPCAGTQMLEKYGATANELGAGSKNCLWRLVSADAFQLPLSPSATIHHQAFTRLLAQACGCWRSME